MVEKETIVLGGGCFWCTEAVFKEVKGVTAVQVGYAGGFTDSPSYEDVCNGGTGHAEVLRVDFDPAQVSLPQILEVFFKMHDPTSVDRQGADVGSQYRSIILFSNPAQLPIIQTSLQKEAEHYRSKLATSVGALKKFYPAEEYHQNYFEKHPSASYCAFVVRPKVEKVRDHFPDLVEGDRR